MLGIIWTALGGLRGLIAGILFAGAALTAAAAYDRLIDDPAVALAARQDFVARSELVAVQAQLAEMQRQRDVGAQALEEYRKRLGAYRAAEAAEDARHETEIADYEAKLAALNRTCALDQDDIDFLNGRGPH